MNPNAWVAFISLSIVILGAAMHGESRLVRIETKLDLLWRTYLHDTGHREAETK